MIALYFSIAAKTSYMYSSVSQKPYSSQLSSNHVNIYLRNYKKMATLVPIPPLIICNDLRLYVASKYKVNVEKIGLFLNGERIDIHPTRTIELKDKSIIHVVQLDRTRRQELIVYFKFPQQPGQNLKVKTSSKAQIRSIFESHIIPFYGRSEKQVFFAYLGKPINIFKTFEDELIENECQLLLVEFKKEKVQIKHFQTLNQSLQSKHNVSIASTKMLGMPMMGGRDRSTINNQKQKVAQTNKNKGPQNISILEQVAPPELEKLEHVGQDQKNKHAAPNESSQKVQQSAAPQAYYGFDPHGPSAAPKDKSFEEKPEKLNKTPLSELSGSQVSNPQAQNTKIKEKDLLYMGFSHMEETQNFTAGAVHEYRQNFLHKKSSSGKQKKK